jgi:hypothetical protein
MNKNKIIPPPIEGFSAVQMMREIREKLSERYWKHPDILKKDMEKIREKYHFRLSESSAKPETSE